MRTWITALAVTVVLTGAATACGGSNKPVTDTGTVPTTFSGRDIYAQKCAICHGAQGEGGAGPRLAGQVAAAKFPRVENEETYVRDGNKSMPAFGQSLSPDQIRAVVAFTRQL
jgi:mono/diheme cytochrome c family protein